MADNSPILIGRDNIADPGAETLLSRDANSTSPDPVFTVRTPVGGDGIHGEASGNSTGVQGISTTTGIGVKGASTDGHGVQGKSSSRTGVEGGSTSGFGVHGFSSTSVGVRGFSTSSSGVSGFSTSSSGVSGTSTSGTGVSGTSTGTSSTGVSGISNDGRGVDGSSTNSVGVFGSSRNGVGLFGHGFVGVLGLQRPPVGTPFAWAGEFVGDVRVTGRLEKQGGGFRIDHPQNPANKYLTHSFVESDDMKNLYDGVARLDEDGAAWVELPEWFEALNGDFRYQLTAVGGSAPGLHVAEEVSESRFKIAGGEEGMKVCWQLTGTRKDPWATANPFEVEQEKPEEERGRYLEPALYDAPEEQRVMVGPPIPEAVEEEQRPPQPSGIDFARLEEEHRRQLDEWRRLEEEHRREMEELRRRMEEQQEEPPPEST
jgi:hypothetical protein